ncbi:MAG TPA: alpha-glucan family phosphorylase [Polyangiaceae bacterium]|nr:alpha-glucan family phosphorylase [Polyangiaceae bacterium]
MPNLRRFTVVPRLPPGLERLREIAYNLWWTWSTVAHELFVRIDPDLWDSVHGNPIELLARVDQARLDELAGDDAFTSHLEAAWQTLQRYMQREGWFSRSFPDAAGARIAYFSMEYGLHECLPVYSGGLGVLAGDHLKTASDLGLPLVGVGLAYAEGYFRQVLNSDGWQGERYPINDWHRLPVLPVHDGLGKRLVIRVEYPTGTVLAQLWRVQVGRVPLLLLDSNVEENAAADRSITGPLYGGDQEFRVRQEIMLGIGGITALEAMGLSPTVCHMNEGHSAFLTIERIRRTMRDRGVSFSVASEANSAGNIFTTHTPVPAGNDAFEPGLARRYLEPYRAGLGISADDLLALGRVDHTESAAPFSMPVLAMRAADHYNGVSELHGRVSRTMWRGLWPELPTHEIPIEHVTNGVHMASWVASEMGALFTRYLGPRWTEHCDDPDLWERAYEIPDAELWHVHEHRRHRLVQHARRWLRSAAERRGAGLEELTLCDEVLDPQALTIGFARRFATYKRATLLFTDLERVKKLLGHPDRPVQLVFAGKAHPQDKGGKELIRRIIHASRDAGLRGRVVFVEDYDMRIARALVSGVDVWLNTPRRPFEASGTSGMKAAAHGALNVSVLDGWFAEAWQQHGWEIGWAIGRGEEYADGSGDAREAELLYDVLEHEVVPLFYSRDGLGRLPRGWIRRMKNTISKLVPRFNTARMVREYSSRFYVPAIKLTQRLGDGDLAAAKALTAWKDRVRAAWQAVAVKDVRVDSPDEVAVGEPVRVSATVQLGALAPDDVAVELYHGPTNGGHEIALGKIVRMRPVERVADGAWQFSGEIPTDQSGAHAFAARVVPYNDTMTHPYETSLIRWA